MANKHMERCSISHIYREMQIRIRVRHHYAPIRMAKSRTLITANAGKDVEQQELSFTAGGHAKWRSHFGREFGGFLQN